MDFEKERAEALSAGQRAYDSLKTARSILSDARGLGIYDTFFGGGFISGMLKHSKMGKAEECINRAKEDLYRFNNELQDLKIAGINLDTSDFIGIADIIFDGFLTDYLMQRRIKEACKALDDAISKVGTILTRLKNL